MTDAIDRISSLRKLARQDGLGYEPFNTHLFRHLQDGHDWNEIFVALAGTKWRYEIKSSGLDVRVWQVEVVTERYEDSLTRLSEAATKLRAVELSASSPSDIWQEVGWRRHVALCSRDHAWTVNDVRKYALESDLPDMDADRDIENALALHGFDWNGRNFIWEIESPALKHEHRYLCALASTTVTSAKSLDSAPDNVTSHAPSPEGRTAFLSILAIDVDEKTFIDHVSRHVRAGLPIREVVCAIKGTDWRYAIRRSGTTIEVRRLQSLMEEYNAVLERACMLCADLSRLPQCELSAVPTAELLRIIAEREEAGTAIFDVDMAYDHFSEFAAASDVAPSGGDKIEDILDDLGFYWDQYFMIEEKAGSAEALYRAVLGRANEGKADRAHEMEAA